MRRKVHRTVLELIPPYIQTLYRGAIRRERRGDQKNKRNRALKINEKIERGQLKED